MAELQYADIPELAAQEEAIRKRQAIAQLLMQQGAAPIEQAIEPRTRTPVPISWTQGLAQLADAYVGKKGSAKADEELKDLAKKKSEGEAAAVNDYLRARGGVIADPGMSQTFMKPSGDTERVGTESIVDQAANPRKAIADLLASPYAPQGVKALALQENAPYTLGQGDTRIQAGQVIGQGTPAPIKPETPLDELAKLNADYKAGRISKEDFDARRLLMTTRGTGSSGEAGGANDYSPETIRTGAMVVMSDPTRMRDYASYGNSGQQTRVKINNEISKIKKETGMSDSDLIQLRARAKAQTTNLSKLSQQESQVQQAEGLARANGQRLLDLIGLVDQTGVPLIEGVTRSARAKAGGIDAAELKSVMTTFQMETARLLASGPSMNGVISDAARTEIQHMSPESMSAAQARRVINRLFTEMDIRKSLVDSALNASAAQTVVSGQGGSPAVSVEAPKADFIFNPATGKLEPAQ